MMNLLGMLQIPVSNVAFSTLAVVTGAYYMTQRVKRYRTMRHKAHEENATQALQDTFRAERIGLIGTVISLAMVPIMVVAILLFDSSLNTVKLLVFVAVLGFVVTLVANLVAGWSDDGSWRDGTGE